MRVLSEELRRDFASQVVGTIWRFQSTDSPIELPSHAEEKYQKVLSHDLDDLDGTVTQNILISILHDNHSMIKFLNYLDQVFKDSEIEDQGLEAKLLNSIYKAMDILESYIRIIHDVTNFSVDSGLGFIEKNSEFGDVIARGLREKLGIETPGETRLKIHKGES